MIKKEHTLWFVFYKDQVLMEQHPDGYHIPTGQEPPVKVPVGSTIHDIGDLQGMGVIFRHDNPCVESGVV